jgi:hypothetical protein
MIVTMTAGKYFNGRVLALDSPYIGHILRKTDDKISVFSEGNDRYDIPRSEIQMTGRNVLLGLGLADTTKNTG